MAGVKTLADGRIKLAVLTTKPTNPAAPTLTEINAGTDASLLAAKSSTRVTPSGSDMINDPELGSSSNAPVFGPSNYDGTIAPFWMLDATTGKYAAADNPLYEALTPKGSRVWLYFREGPESSTNWATGDVVDGYEVVTDDPQRPTETGGYVKRIIPLGVQNAYLDITIAAGSGTGS